MSTVPIDRERAQALIATACALHVHGLTVANSGNVSVRVDGGFLITPSGVLYEDLAVQDIVLLGLDGTVRAGHRKPSSEWRFHRDIFRANAAVGAIVHTHAHYCTALACLRRDIPAFHYMVAKAGGNSIPCAGYATFGTQALSDAVVAALDNRRACLMANHGMIATGATLPAALQLAQEVESLAGLYCQALTVAAATGTVPVLLDDAEMARVAQQFAGYGQPG